ncbi:MAG: TCR/Tet family MFS transporter [Gemmatimonadaceae bacterium]|nr:TCR/Tet family MFS transporter [Gemmatimonadaceae bacterium]MCW5826518.1 TCR/Tet family MFS transporter [Gemmatimonadaceae bacterium]
MTPRRAALAFIFVSIVLDIVAFGIVIPVLPKLIESFVDFDAARAAQWVGLFGTVWALMQFCCAPLLGALSDRFGRRPVLLLSISGLGLDYVFMALAPTLGWLFVGRIISGMTAAGFATAAAYIADVTEPERRAAAFGLVGAAWGFGFVVGPALGGILGAADPRLPFWVAGALALVNAAYGFFVLPESLPPEKRAAFDLKRANPLGSLRFLQANRQLFGLAGTSFLYNLGHTVFPSVFVIWASYRYGWDAKAVGLSLAVVGIANILVQGGLVRPLVRRVGARRAMAIGAAAGTLGFALYGIAAAVPLFWLAIFVYAPAGVFNPSLMGAMSKRVGPSEQGRLQGATSSLMGVAGMLGPGLFTLSFAWAIRPGGIVHLPGLPFLIAAALFAAAGLLAMRSTTPESD